MRLRASFESAASSMAASWLRARGRGAAPRSSSSALSACSRSEATYTQCSHVSYRHLPLWPGLPG